MNGWIILAEAATNHPDGTTSMLRAGIDRLWAPTTPVPFRAAVIARIEGHAGERGSHDLEISCIDEDGKDRLPTIKGQFNLPPTGGKNTLVLALQVKLDRFGVYVFNLLVDRVLLDSWNLHVEKSKEEANADSGR